jgi:rare lipoprotein A (peptidoglycan hydrolase)
MAKSTTWRPWWRRTARCRSNTWVRVYDLDNNKTVEVRIIDRGPFVDGRIIDLSHAAAQAIDMIGPGIANVRMEVIGVPAGVAAGDLRGAGGRVPEPRHRRAHAGGLAEHYGRRA